MFVQSVARTDIGRTRPNNGDAVFRDDALGLYMVCDGMGSNASGERAAQMAVETISSELLRHTQRLKDARLDSVGDTSGIVDDVTAAIRLAGKRVYDDGQARGHDGGTTVTLLLLLGARALVAHVGDSRLYLRRDGCVHLMTSDHTGAAVLMNGQKWNDDLASRSPMQSILTKAVGRSPDIAADVLVFDVAAGDRFLVCSDGLSRYVFERTELCDALGAEFAGIADSLVARANAAGGRDNIAAITVELTGQAGEPGHGLAGSKLLGLANAFGFQSIRVRPLQILANAAQVRPVDPDEVLVARDAECDQLIMVLAGELRLQDGEGTCTSVRAGDFVGRRFLFEPARVHAELRCISPAQVLELSSAAFWGKIRAHPVLAIQVLSRVGWRAHRKVDGIMSSDGAPEPNDLF